MRDGGVAGGKIVWIALLLALAAGIVWWRWQDEPRETAAAAAANRAPASVRVNVSAVLQRDVPQTVKLAATVYANATVAVKARLDSQVMAVHFNDGDKVEKGALLFELDNRALKAQRAELAANLQRDTVQLKNAKAQYERSEKLSKQGFTTSEKLDQDKTAYEAMQASLVATKATLDNIDILMDYTNIRAPISGRAGTIAVTEGNNVKANDTTPLVTINQIDPILVQFAVPQRYYDKLKAAMARSKLTVTASRAETGVALSGVLEYIDNAIDLNNGTFVARARFDNAEEKLWPGMFVDVMLTLDTLKDALTVPAAAVQGERDQQFVFVADADSKAARRKITAHIQGDIAVVSEGLSAGERVVADGLLRITNGAQLEIAPGGQESTASNDNDSDKAMP